MFCVIQEVRRKKADAHGAYREYEVSSMTIQFPDGSSKTHYSYYPKCEAGRFDRPHMECFKISIHESHRESGRVVKKQCAIATIGYYDFANGVFSLYDYIDGGINRAVEMFNTDYETLYKLVEDKIQPIIDKVKMEFHSSEEYKAVRQREKIEEEHQKAKKKFGEQYDIAPDEYDYCYNIFGELMDEGYLNQIIRQYEQQKKACEERQRSYRKSGGSTHEQHTNGSYCASSASNYNEYERAILKKFYRSLSKTYHPDLNRNEDTAEAMKLLNKLKEQWGV